MHPCKWVIQRLSRISKLCSHPHSPVLKPFRHPKMLGTRSHCSQRQPPVCSVSVHFPFLGTSCTWNWAHAVFCVRLLSRHVLGCPCCSTSVLVPSAAESTPGCGYGCSCSFPHWGRTFVLCLPFDCEEYCCSAHQQTRLCVYSSFEWGLGGKHSLGIDNAGKNHVLDFRSVSGVRMELPEGCEPLTSRTKCHGHHVTHRLLGVLMVLPGVWCAIA